MKQLDMVNKMYALIRKDKETNEEAFEAMIAFVASKFTFKAAVNIPWIKMDTLNALNEIFKLEVLQEDPWDWFGELDTKLKLGLFDKNLLIGQSVLEKVADKLKLPNKSIEPNSVLDDNAYTGRNIIEMWKKDKNTIFYGVESDLLAYRVALVNMRCYGIPSSIIFGNSFEHDVRPFSPNWRDANVWEPNKNRITIAETDERLRKIDGFHRIV